MPVSTDCNSGRRPSASRSPARSRGRAERSATRARMRSMSPPWRSSACTATCRPVSSKASMACRRRSRGARGRSGRWIQRRSSRPPIAVAVRSRTPISVLSGRPDRLVSSSRLRRVAASSSSASSRSSQRMPRRCGSADFCVSRRYCSRQPAAPTARGRPASPKPARSRVPNCSQSCRPALPSSKCQGGLERTAVAGPASPRTGASSGTSNSAGRRRSSSAAIASRPVASSAWKRPLASSIQASPKLSPAMDSAASSVSRRSSSSASSVTVPGVTTRTTCRSTGPLAFAGSPICSQIATDSPLRTARARYVSSVCTGTPAIGIGSPADWPRAVSVMSSSRAARRASSKKSS
jgi:hypothetical protein